jgi:alpha-tubulin suppressor-like RCC1 family protein
MKMGSLFFRFFKKPTLLCFLLFTPKLVLAQWGEPAQLSDYTVSRIPAVSNRWTSKEMMNDPDFAALLDDGSLFVWGSHYNNLGTVLERPPERNIISVFSSGVGFVSLLDDQHLITVAPTFNLKYPTPDIPQGHHVISLASNWDSFAALLEDGSILCWGDLQAPKLPTGQKAISLFSSGHSFCAILEKEGADQAPTVQTILSWGKVKTPSFSLGKNKVISVIGNDKGFCALLDDGTLRLWGNKNNTIEEPLRDSMKRVSMKEGALCATSQSFIVLFEDGNLHAWGDLITPELPYDDSGFWFPWDSPQKLHAVSLMSNQTGITITLENGSFFNAWIKTTHSCDTSGKWHVDKQQMTQHILAPRNKNGQKLDLKYLVASDRAFTALFNNGSVLSWGDENTGGKTPDLGNNKAIEVVSSGGSFTALLENGKIRSWGALTRGGQTPQLPSDHQGHELTVRKMIGNGSLMSALLNDGTLLMWGWGLENNQMRINLPEGKKFMAFVSPFEKFVLCGTFLEKECEKIAFP